MRQIIDLSKNWKFHNGDLPVSYPKDKGSVYYQSKTARKLIGPAAYNYYDKVVNYSEVGVGAVNSDGWIDVELPHDFIIEQNADKNQNGATGFFKYGKGWYRKHFSVAESNEKQFTLEFEGVAGDCIIYLNGCVLKHNFSRYNSFAIDITDYLFFDKENVLAVFVDASWFEGWWYQGGGIYRNVYITVTDKVHIDRYGVYAPYKRLSENKWQIDYEVTIVNSSDYDKEVTAIVEIDSNKVSKKEVILSRSTHTIHCSTVLDNVKLWYPEAPYLYEINTTIEKDGEICDNYKTRTGFREFYADADKGLFINNKSYKIKGVCAHQDFGLTGLAVPDNIAKYKIELIKQMGANGYRTSHYQQSTATMDALDELGFIVMNEVRWFESTEENLVQIEELVKRDRNRPSVFFWSTGNEEPLHIHDVGKRIHNTIRAKIKSLDNHRLIVSAVSRNPDKAVIYYNCDAVAMNYNLNLLEDVRKLYPDKPFISSENCATGTSYGCHFNEYSNDRIQDIDADTNEHFWSRSKTWEFIDSRDYIMGGYQWDAFEHRGEAVWPSLCSKSGAIGMYLQKKGAFYQNLSLWSDEPMIHIVPHWNFKGLEGHIIDVPVYTNAKKAELFINGKSQGCVDVEKYGYAHWSVAFEKGVIEAVGYMQDGRKISHKKVTPDTPFKLKLTSLNRIHKGKHELALFSCECFDENGNIIENFKDTIRFSTTKGAHIVATASETTDSTSVTENTRNMNGWALVGIYADSEIEQFTLYAQSNSGLMACFEYDCL